ncbi:MAG: hypothetical protein MI922_27795 [Bacteroidales bacterium]|nr:hypothetical protein [Bacteroidales bacterium]
MMKTTTSISLGLNKLLPFGGIINKAVNPNDDNALSVITDLDKLNVGTLCL